MVFQYEPTVDLSGKLVVVTGGSAGVGRISCFKLAKCNAKLIVAGRNKDKTVAVIEEIIKQTGNKNVEFLQLALDDLQSVKQAAQTLLDRNEPIHILMNNAGIAGLGGLTKDGYEITFGTNHLGPFLFTEMLLPLVKKAAPSRIVFVSSTASERGAKYDWTALKVEDTTTAHLQPYGNSKLANALYAKKLSQMLDGSGVTTYSLHPGVVATDIWKAVPWPFQSMIKWFMLSEEEGAITQLYCATEPSLANESGKFYDDCKTRVPNKLLDDQAYIDELYEKSRELLEEYL